MKSHRMKSLSHLGARFRTSTRGASSFRRTKITPGQQKISALSLNPSSPRAFLSASQKSSSRPNHRSRTSTYTGPFTLAATIIPPGKCGLLRFRTAFWLNSLGLVFAQSTGQCTFFVNAGIFGSFGEAGRIRKIAGTFIRAMSFQTISGMSFLGELIEGGKEKMEGNYHDTLRKG